MSKKQEHPQVGYAILKSHAVALGDEESTFLDAPPKYALNQAVQDRQATRSFMRQNWWKMVLVGWFVVGLALTQMVVVNRMMGGSMGRVELTRAPPMDRLMPVTGHFPHHHGGQGQRVQAGAHRVPVVAVTQQGPGRTITLTIEACPACRHHIRPAPSAAASWFRHMRMRAMLRFAEIQRSQIVQAMRRRVLALLNRPIVDHKSEGLHCTHPHHHGHHKHHGHHGHHHHHRRHHRHHDHDGHNGTEQPTPEVPAAEVPTTAEDGLVHIAAPEPTFATAVMPPDEQSPPDDGLVHPVETGHIFKTTVMPEDDEATLRLHPILGGAALRRVVPVA